MNTPKLIAALFPGCIALHWFASARKKSAAIIHVTNIRPFLSFVVDDESTVLSSRDVNTS